ncbi:hypothetical protein L3X07_06875 [Levilactobacillus brevis]|nr:hypothetical protein [Levilactobacillus brevis]
MDQSTAHHLPPRIKRIWGYSALGNLLVLLIISGLLWLAYHFWNWPRWLSIGGLMLTLLEPGIELD